MELGHRGKRAGQGALPVMQKCQSNSMCAALPAVGCWFARGCHSLEGLQAATAASGCACCCAHVHWGSVYLLVLVTLSTARMMSRLRVSGGTQLCEARKSKEWV